MTKPSNSGYIVVHQLLMSFGSKQNILIFLNFVLTQNHLEVQPFKNTSLCISYIKRA